MKKSKLGFYGGVGSVTGANFYLDTGTAKLLVDCGLRQGTRMEEEENQKPFPSPMRTLTTLVGYLSWSARDLKG
jgi:metallo-beta-lactamase family protein